MERGVGGTIATGSWAPDGAVRNFPPEPIVAIHDEEARADGYQHEDGDEQEFQAVQVLPDFLESNGENHV